jgi:hypothetical protein
VTVRAAARAAGSRCQLAAIVVTLGEDVMLSAIGRLSAPYRPASGRSPQPRRFFILKNCKLEAAPHDTDEQAAARFRTHNYQHGRFGKIRTAHAHRAYGERLL